MAYQSINPNDGKLLQSFEHLGDTQLDNVLAAAESCFQTWRHKSYAERALILTKAAALLHAHVDDIAPGNPAFRDEFFGPVVSFFRVNSEDEAIALVNDSDFGLGGSVWTKDDARGLRLASRVDAGILFVNNLDWTDAQSPFGGIKYSGYGRELVRMGIQEFVNHKLVRSGHIAAPV